uniref:Uncharacterized protein n=1 Tax=Chenopodium quinoa TaxID=63459 RepID=A0A803MV89_CHEQI
MKMMIEIMNNKLQLFNVVLFILTTIVATKLMIKWAPKTLFRSSKRPPPVVKGRLPLIRGVVRFLSNPVEMLNEEYQTLGSVFTMNAVYKNITFLLEPDVSAHFFKAGETELSQREVYQFTVPIFGPGVVYDAVYSVRQEQFHFFEDALRIDNLRGYADAMLEEVQDYFSKWEEKGEVDLKQEMENIIILMASRCFLGKDIRDSLSKDIIALIKEINVAMVPLTTLFPYLPIPPHNRRDKARKKLDEVFSNIIASRQSSHKTKDDMLQCLIDSKYKDGRATSVGEVTGLLVTALYGGQHTGAATSIWTGVFLLHYKQHWFTAKAEQKELMKKHGNKVNYDVLLEMQLLYRCIKESLRLHPPNAFLLRQSHTDFTMTSRRDGTKYDIPKGHIIAASPFFSNRLPHIYKKPNDYDPDRFTPEKERGSISRAVLFLVVWRR